MFRVQYPLFYLKNDLGGAIYLRDKMGRVVTFVFTSREYAESYGNRCPNKMITSELKDDVAMKQLLEDLPGLPEGWIPDTMIVGFDPIEPSFHFQGNTAPRASFILSAEERDRLLREENGSQDVPGPDQARGGV